MSIQNQPLAEKRPSTPRELIKVTTVAYLLMAVVGFEICWWYHKNIQTLFGAVTYDLGKVAGMVIAAVLFLHYCQRILEEFFPTYKKFKFTLAAMFSGLGWLGAFWLALTSSIGEEILFRGAIQPFLGIWFTSIIFGLLHLDPEGGVSIWTGWAVIAGLVLGGMVSVTGSLWPSILVHLIINFMGILSLSKLKIQPIKRS